MATTRRLRREWAARLGPWDRSAHQARALRVVARADGQRLGAVSDALRITAGRPPR
ncbi:MAG: hypothetical protein ACK5RL_03210 [Acidimicrobiales bacterium]